MAASLFVLYERENGTPTLIEIFSEYGIWYKIRKMLTLGVVNISQY